MEKIYFEAIAKVTSKTAYAVSADINAFFKIDMITGDSDYIGVIPEEKVNEPRLYTKAVYENGKIYFVPLAAREIAVYNVSEGTLYKLKIKDADNTIHVGYKKKRKFGGAVTFHQYIFFTPCTYPGIIRIDTANDQLVYFDNWIDTNPYVFRKSLEVDQQSFFVPSTINNLVLRFNMETCTGKLYHVGKHNCGCWSMCKVGDDFWLAPQKQGPVIRWNHCSGLYQEYNDYPDGFQGNDFLFTKIYYTEGNLILIPGLANMGIAISTNDYTMRKSDMTDFQNRSSVMLMFEIDEYLYLRLTDDQEDKLVRLNSRDNSIKNLEYISCKGLNEYHKDCIRLQLEKKKIATERDNWGLGAYLSYIVSNN